MGKLYRRLDRQTRIRVGARAVNKTTIRLQGGGTTTTLDVWENNNNKLSLSPEL